MKRINKIMEHALAARREALSLKIPRDRKRVLAKADDLLAELALIASGWIDEGEDDRAAKRRRFE